MSQEFINAWKRVAERANDIALEHGFWDKKTNVESLALVHSEISEAIEAVRNRNPESTKIPKYSSLEEELADTVIRIMDFGANNGLRLPEAILAKQEFNAGRPYKHGKAF